MPTDPIRMRPGEDGMLIVHVPYSPRSSGNVGRIDGPSSCVSAKLLTIFFFLCFAVGCSTTHSGFSKPDLSKVRTGMTKQEVISALGTPDNISAQGRAEYLEYGWDKFMDGLVGAAEWYYVRLVDSRVESFGHKGDFDSTKNPAVDLNINQKVITDGTGRTPDSVPSADLFTRLKKLQALKDDGLLTDEEFQKLRRKAIEESK